MGLAAVSLGALLVLSVPAKAATTARPPASSIVIANWAPRPIREIYLSPASSQDWSVDRLEGRSVSPGDDVRLSYGGACRADLRVVFDNGGAEERRDLDLCRNRFIGIRPGWTTSDELAAPGPPALISVQNRSGRTIARLYLAPDGAAEPGEDRLGNDVLPDGEEIDVLRPLAATCDFSLQVIFADNGTAQHYGGVDLCRHREIIVEPPRR